MVGVPLGFVLVVALLRDATGGVTSGFAGLFLLPVIFYALVAGRAAVMLGLAATAVAQVVPLVVAGAPAYPRENWRAAFVQIAVASLAGFTIQRLMSQSRDRARLMASQNRRLQELDRAKDEVVALVSHELRTPLTSIAGYVELLAEDAAAGGPVTHRQFLATVTRNVNRLTGLVDDLLFVARIDEGKTQLVIDRIDIAEMLGQAIDASRPAADAKTISLDLALDGDIALRGDHQRLAQVFDNLIGNAIKFTPAGGRVAVRGRRRGDRVEVEVEDTGVGIPADELPSLFTRFFRATTARAIEAPGTGLGLVIASSIVESHGGSITVRSDVGVGTTFAVTLPRDPQFSGSQ